MNVARFAVVMVVPSHASSYSRSHVNARLHSLILVMGNHFWPLLKVAWRFDGIPLTEYSFEFIIECDELGRRVHK